MTTIGTTETREARVNALGQTLERAGWALFLIMIAGLALLPDGWVPAGAWLIGTGIIMVGLNIVRYFKGVRVDGFANFLGLIALAIGVSAVTGVDVPVLAVLLGTIGVQMLVGILFPKGVAR